MNLAFVLESDDSFEISTSPAPHRAVRKRGHRRICSKSYSNGSGMIQRLDVAVER